METEEMLVKKLLKTLAIASGLSPEFIPSETKAGIVPDFFDCFVFVSNTYHVKIISMLRVLDRCTLS